MVSEANYSERGNLVLNQDTDGWKTCMGVGGSSGGQGLSLQWKLMVCMITTALVGLMEEELSMEGTTSIIILYHKTKWGLLSQLSLQSFETI